MFIKKHPSVAALLSLFLVASCSPDNKPDSEKSAEEVKDDKAGWKYASLPISHQKWDGLLKAHVNNEGRVDYKGMTKTKPNSMNTWPCSATRRL